MAAAVSDECSRLLEFQYGTLARWQAAAADLNPAVIDERLRRGRWQLLYSGVYAAYTGGPARESLQWAALLRAGKGAALSHQTAAELDGLDDRRGDAIHVTVGNDRRVRISAAERRGWLPRVIIHRTGRLEAAVHPARTPPRTRIEETVLDLAQAADSFDDAFACLCRGCGRRLVTPQALQVALGGRSRMRWRDEITRALASIAEGVHSNLEYRYVRDVERAHALPSARRQARLAGHGRSSYLDNLYDGFDLAVELDGQAAHRAEDRWRDIHRDNLGATAGITTLRYNWADVAGRPCGVAAQIASVLRLRGWDGRPRRCSPVCAAQLIVDDPPSYRLKIDHDNHPRSVLVS
jgi:very-short-patch-repair endonuclease